MLIPVIFDTSYFIRYVYFISHLIRVPCVILSHSGERVSSGLMYRAVVCARKQFL